MSEPIQCDNYFTKRDILRAAAVKRDGGISFRVRGIGPVWCEQYQLIYDAYITKPTDEQAEIDNLTVEQLVAAGLWYIFDIIRMYGVHVNTGGEALINCVNPGTFGATAINAPTFTPFQGFLFNGTNQYITHNWIPATNGVNYQQNSACQVLYIRTNVGSAAVASGHGHYAMADNKETFLNPRRATNLAYIRNNGNNSDAGANTNGSGLYVNTRTAFNVKTLYRNAVPIVNGVQVSVGRPTRTPYTGACNDDGIPINFRPDEVFFEAWGAGLSQAQVTTLNTIIEANAVAKGVGVQ